MYEYTRMRKNVLALLASCWILPLASGCAPLWIAGGAVAGYAASRDSVTMDLDQPRDQVWGAALEEIRTQGSLKRENLKRGRLDARIQEADVVLILKQLSPSTVRVVIRARRNLLPKVEVAQGLAVAILRRVERNRQIP